MIEGSRKDILTRERIMIDIKNVYIDDIKAILKTSLTLLVVMVMPPIILYKVFTPFDIPSHIATAITIFAVIITIATLLFLYRPVKAFLDLNKKGFQIASDKLCNSEEMTMSDIMIFNNWWMIWALTKPHRLSFNSYGEYRIPKGKNYRWSDMYCMDDKGVCNCSVIGDEFYLAVIDNKVALAYNKKLFELQN